MPADPYSAGIQAVLGLGTSIAGGIISGNAAKRRKRALQEIANTPGVNIGDVYGESIGASTAALPGAQNLAGLQNTFNAAELDRLLESAVPGLKGMQTQRAGNTAAFLRGEIPSDVGSSVYRGAVGRSLEGGYGGSPAGRNLVARDLGRTSLDLMRLGGSELDASVRGAPLPAILQTQDILNIGPRETLGLRSGERSRRLDDLQLAAGSPGRSDVWGKILQDLGGQLMGGAGGFGSIAGMAGGK
jgi:hypothetical protein